MDIRSHYDLLIEENNDPFRDPPALRKYMESWDGQVFLDLMELDESKTVLEIGVGTGRLAIKTAGCCRWLTGIDISPKTIERARENLQHCLNISLICDDFITHQFTETFDVVYSSLTMMHFQDKRSVIGKIHALLKCKEIGYTEIKLFPMKSNEPTVKIMLKNGGQIIGDFKNQKHIIRIPLE